MDLSSHLRERKRIIQNVADLEHRSGERPAVIATLTWGGYPEGVLMLISILLMILSSPRRQDSRNT